MADNTDFNVGKGIRAAQAGQLNKLYQTLNNYLRKRG